MRPTSRKIRQLGNTRGDSIGFSEIEPSINEMRDGEHRDALINGELYIYIKRKNMLFRYGPLTRVV